MPWVSLAIWEHIVAENRRWFIIQQATLINPTLAQSRIRNEIKHPVSQHGDGRKSYSCYAFTKKWPPILTNERKKARTGQGWLLLHARSGENRVTNYQLLPTNTVEGQAYLQARRGAFWSIIRDARKIEKEVARETQESRQHDAITSCSTVDGNAWFTLLI